jgi:hypothetical protein
VNGPDASFHEPRQPFHCLGKSPAWPEDSQGATISGIVRIAESNGNPIPLTLTLSLPPSRRAKAPLRRDGGREREQPATCSVVREVRRADTALGCAERQSGILPLLPGRCLASGVLPSSAAATFLHQKHRYSTNSRPRPTRLRPRTGALRQTCTLPEGAGRGGKRDAHFSNRNDTSAEFRCLPEVSKPSLIPSHRPRPKSLTQQIAGWLSPSGRRRE